MHFYGVNIRTELEKKINDKYFSLKGKTFFYDRIPNEELVHHMVKSNLFLLFNHYSMMGTKIYNYIGLKRKILFCYRNDEESEKLKRKYYAIEERMEFSKNLQIDLIEKTNSGIIVENKEHLRMVLQDLYKDLINEGEIKCDSTGVELYSRKLQVKRLAEMLNELKR